MPDSPLDAEVRSALFDLQQYLSDKMAPLMVADAITVLLNHPPELVAAEVHAWISAQYRGHGSSIPLSDFLYHTIKKMHAIGEFRLVSADRLQQYLARLSELLVELCPEQDRASLRQNISLLNTAQNVHAAPVEIIHRQAGSESKLASILSSSASGGVVMSEEAALGLRRFTQILERWSAANVPSELPKQTVQSQVITTAVNTSSNAAQLDELLVHAREHGIEAQPDKLFQVLGSALPPWAVPLSVTGEETALSGPAEAMHKIVTMAQGPGEAGRRLRQMVRAAVGQFNEGSLARSVTMFELAERIIAERSVPDAEVASMRSVEYESLDPEKLRKLIESRDSHFLLKKVLSFFSPSRLESLFDQLRHEQARDRRRAILALIEVYGNEARNDASRQLEEILTQKPDAETHFYARNLLFVLGRIPRPADSSIDKELDLLAGFSSSSYRAIVVREAINILAQTKADRTEKILITRLHDVESMLASPGVARYSMQEARQLLDRIISALSKVGTPMALSAIVEHALRTNEQYGDTKGRLAALAQHDLSEAPEVEQRLIEGIRNELPRKVLGLFNQKKSTNLPRLVEALAATSSPQTRELLEEIVERYPDSDFGKSAQKILEQSGATARVKPVEHVAPTLSGDLELLGLPNLLQSLSEMQLTGVLTLTSAERGASTIALRRGEVAHCENGILSGKEALFQIFEESKAANFAFVSKQPEEIQTEQTYAVAPIVFEAMRRHDELTRARLLIPPAATLSPTGAKPSAPVSEKDPSVVRDVWVKASSGQPPARWESMVKADAYRVWKLLEHWVDNGALEVVHSKPAP